MKKLKKIVLVFCVFLSSFLVFLIPFGAKTQGLDSRFGINSFVINRYPEQELGKPIQAIQDLGAGFSREEFVWEQIEPARGSFNWASYDNAVDKLTSAGIGILGILDYSAPWATEKPDQEDADKYMPNLLDWQSYVGRVVDHYKDKVRYWQIWNEPNVPVFFKPAPNAEKYLELLKSADQIIKQKEPGAQVVIAGMSGVDVGYLRELESLGAGDYFDILAIHPYSFDFNSEPEDLFNNNMKTAEDIAKEFGNKPIWLTEFGWPTDSAGKVTEDIQAKYLARIYLLSYQFSDIQKLFWYDLRNDGSDLQNKEDNFGLLYSDYTKKESYYAYRNLINILNGSQFISANINKAGTYDFSFIKGDEKIRAIWDTEGETTFNLEADFNNLKILNLAGQSITPQIGNNAILISDSPIFIIQNEKKSKS